MPPPSFERHLIQIKTENALLLLAWTCCQFPFQDMEICFRITMFIWGLAKWEHASSPICFPFTGFENFSVPKFAFFCCFIFSMNTSIWWHMNDMYERYVAYLSLCCHSPSVRKFRNNNYSCTQKWPKVCCINTFRKNSPHTVSRKVTGPYPPTLAMKWVSVITPPPPAS